MEHIKKSLYIAERKYPVLYRRIKEIDAEEVQKYGETKGGSTQMLLQLIDQSQQHELTARLDALSQQIAALQANGVPKAATAEIVEFVESLQQATHDAQIIWDAD